LDADSFFKTYSSSLAEDLFQSARQSKKNTAILICDDYDNAIGIPDLKKKFNEWVRATKLDFESYGLRFVQIFGVEQSADEENSVDSMFIDLPTLKFPERVDFLRMHLQENSAHFEDSDLAKIASVS
jgi:hypothetical protein